MVLSINFLCEDLRGCLLKKDDVFTKLLAIICTLILWSGPIPHDNELTTEKYGFFTVKFIMEKVY